jgi:hypothetical protein
VFPYLLCTAASPSFAGGGRKQRRREYSTQEKKILDRKTFNKFQRGGGQGDL